MRQRLYCGFEGFQYYIKPKPLLGAYVDMENFAQGMLKYGGFDEYHVCYNDSFIRSLSKDEFIRAYFKHERLKVVKLRDLIKDPNIPYQVIHFEVIKPYEEIVFRNMLSDRTVPVTRRIYTISTIAHLRELLNIYLLNNGGRPYDSIVVPSRAVQNVIQSYFSDVSALMPGKAGYRGRIDSIPYGVDVEILQPKEKLLSRETLGLPTDVTILLSVARISNVSKMNYDRLLEFFARLLKKTDEKLLLLIAGSGSQEDAKSISKICEKLRITDHVEVIVNFDDALKLELFSAADIFVSLSDNLQESFGIALVEAMAMGLPVICTDWDGYKDIVENEITGYRLPVAWRVQKLPEDILVNFSNPYDHSVIHRISQDLEIDIDLFVMRALSLIYDQNLRKEMGQRAREKAIREYSLKTVVAQFEALWSELYETAQGDDTQYSDLGPVLHYEYPKHFKVYPSHLIMSDEKDNTASIMAE